MFGAGAGALVGGLVGGRRGAGIGLLAGGPERDPYPLPKADKLLSRSQAVRTADIINVLPRSHKSPGLFLTRPIGNFPNNISFFPDITGPRNAS